VTVVKRIIDMYEKEGRSGTLVFVTQEFTFTNQRGEMVAREQFTRIYR
jgi:hydroxyacyl-ACP dehydratase HTD2-like protein with hotdog domain